MQTLKVQDLEGLSVDNISPHRYNPPNDDDGDK